MKNKLKTTAVHSTALLLIGLALTACNKEAKHKETADALTKREAGFAQTDYQGPALSLLDERGNTLSLESLQGKVVFINFWATWCPPCIEEMPSINKLSQRFRKNDDIVFLMVAVDGKMEASKSFMAKNKYSLKVYIPKGEVPGTLLGGAIPTTVILGKKGEVIARIEGGRDYMAPEIIKLLEDQVTN